MKKELENKRMYTIGHSTRRLEELEACLKAYNVTLLVDVRSIPYSRYNPQFNREDLIEQLPARGLGYIHLSALGGKRPPKEVMDRARSCSERSRGFAEHMQSQEFRNELAKVVTYSESGEVVALMCGEIDPTHCHRFWIAEELQDQGWQMIHILQENDALPHPRIRFDRPKDPCLSKELDNNRRQ